MGIEEEFSQSSSIILNDVSRDSAFSAGQIIRIEPAADACPE